MNRWRDRAKAAVIVFLLLIGSRSVLAAGPTIIMIYGGSLQQPIIVPVTLATMGTYSFLSEWSRGTTPRDMGDRPYLNIAMFWGVRNWTPYLDDPARLSTLRPEQANQHGRLYLPTSSEPGVVMVTAFHGLQNGQQPVPMPRQIADFTSASRVVGGDIETARQLYIPGFVP